MPQVPSLKQILSRTKLKIDDLPGQTWANPMMAFGIACTGLTFVLGAPAIFSPEWKALVREPVMWVYGTSLIFTGVAVLLLMGGLIISAFNATHIWAGQLDKQHADEQAYAGILAQTCSREALDRFRARLQLDIDRVENTKALIAAAGALAGALTPLAALTISNDASGLKPAELTIWATAAASGGAALGLVRTLRFRDHLIRARHVIQEALRPSDIGRSLVAECAYVQYTPRASYKTDRPEKSRTA